MIKIGVCGVFGDGPDFSGGQPVKVKTMIRMLSEHYGKEQVITANTAGWKKRPIRMFMNCIAIARKSDRIIILPAHNGLKVFLPLFLFLRRAFHYKLYYAVIGGWLAEKAGQNSKLQSRLASLDGIWVETNSMAKELGAFGLCNVQVIPNVKYLKPVPQSRTQLSDTPLRCCTFCRVIYEKGIEDAIQAICSVNLNGVKATLDIYGPIYKAYAEKFNEIIQDVPEYIHYKGCAEPDQSVSVLANYDLQIFPTHYRTEGSPGSIIDGYASALPVLASRWNSFDDNVIEGKTGVGFELGNVEDLKYKLSLIISERTMLNEMSQNCLSYYSEVYTPESVLEKIEGILSWD